MRRKRRDGGKIENERYCNKKKTDFKREEQNQNKPEQLTKHTLSIKTHNFNICNMF